MNCFGCGKTGHSMRFCPELRDLASKGVIRYGNNNQWVMNNGSPIVRNFIGEPLTDAIRRLQNSSNLITIDDDYDNADPSDDEVYAIQHEEDYPYAFFQEDPDELDAAAYPVQPSELKAKKARFEGVYPPPPRKDSGVRDTRSK